MNEPNYAPATGASTVVPAEIRKWNWGAFMLNIVWGIGNHAYLTLLCLIPLFNIIWIFVCGAMGNQWAWKSGNFNSVEEFLAVQKTWNRAGIALFIIQIAAIFLTIFFGVAIATAISSAMMY